MWRSRSVRGAYRNAPVVGGLAGGLFHLSAVLAEASEE
jgi:hypothetical protein